MKIQKYLKEYSTPNLERTWQNNLVLANRGNILLKWVCKELFRFWWLYFVYYMSIFIHLMIGELELIKTDNLFHPLSASSWRIWMCVNPKQKYTKISNISISN